MESLDHQYSSLMVCRELFPEHLLYPIMIPARVKIEGNVKFLQLGKSWGPSGWYGHKFPFCVEYREKFQRNRLHMNGWKIP